MSNYPTYNSYHLSSYAYNSREPSRRPSLSPTNIPDTPSPTQSPFQNTPDTKAPSQSPVQSTNAPTTLKPVTESPVTVPPTDSPSSSPVVKSTNAPTNKPVTQSPSVSPTRSPQVATTTTTSTTTSTTTTSTTTTLKPTIINFSECPLLFSTSESYKKTDRVSFIKPPGGLNRGVYECIGNNCSKAPSINSQSWLFIGNCKAKPTPEPTVVTLNPTQQPTSIPTPGVCYCF